jgi:hypothetical protein
LRLQVFFFPTDELPVEEAEALLSDASPSLAEEHVFRAMHTDSNQHVNSLVYPRLFEEAIHRALLARGLAADSSKLLARSVELRYRKPFFLCESTALRMELRPSPDDSSVHDIGGIFPADGTLRPSCTLDMQLA